MLIGPPLPAGLITILFLDFKDLVAFLSEGDGFGFCQECHY